MLKRSHHMGIALCVLAALLWGTNGIFVKKIVGITPLGITSFRLLFGFLGIVFLITYQRRWSEIKVSLKDFFPFFGLGFIMNVNVLWAMHAFRLTTVANAAIVSNTTPIYVTFFAWWILKEKTSSKEWMGIGLTFLGIFSIFSSHEISLTSADFFGNFYALLSAISFAIYIVVGRKLRQSYSYLTSMFWVFGWGGLFGLIESVLMRSPLWDHPDWNDFYYLVVMGILGTLFGHTLFNASLKIIRASMASTINLLSPVASIVYAMIFLQERPTMLTVFGLILVIYGIYFVNIFAPKKGYE